MTSTITDIYFTHRTYFSGWILLGAITFLLLYNVRKRIPASSIGTSRHWFNLHLVVGILSLFIFLFHIQFRIPQGGLESILAGLFLTISFSGIIGIFISRNFAQRLHARGNEVIFEQIHGLREDMAKQADEIALGSVENLHSSIFLDFFSENLRLFFQNQ